MNYDSILFNGNFSIREEYLITIDGSQFWYRIVDNIEEKITYLHKIGINPGNSNWAPHVAEQYELPMILSFNKTNPKETIDRFFKLLLLA